jgi:quercetin dioxygenase-like cupin family protein
VAGESRPRMHYVFSGQRAKRYVYPTHVNDLIVDRSEAEHAEVFIVVIPPRMGSPLHKHDDTEQIFHVMEGVGVLEIGQERQQFRISRGDVVRIPKSTWHRVSSDETGVQYLCVDCFGDSRPANELTWDDHVKVLCRQQGWDYARVIAPGRSGPG